MESIRMSIKELKQYRLAMLVIDGKLSIVDFSIQVDKSYRQSQRIVQRVRDSDALGVRHGNTGKVPHNKTSVKVELQVIDLLKNRYRNFNLTHFNEMAKKHEGFEFNAHGASPHRLECK